MVTNPPFSLFREYVAQLVEHGKKFLIIGEQERDHLQGDLPAHQGQQAVARAVANGTSTVGMFFEVR